MPTRRNNDDERFARIKQLMEEYRIKHEDLQAYLQTVRDQALNTNQPTRTRIGNARVGLRRTRKSR